MQEKLFIVQRLRGQRGMYVAPLARQSECLDTTISCVVPPTQVCHMQVVCQLFVHALPDSPQTPTRDQQLF